MVLPKTGTLEDLDRVQLLAKVRRLLAEADALSSRIAAVNEIGIAINRTLDLDKILHVVAKQAKWLLDFDHCSVCLQQGDSWHVNTLFGPSEATVLNLKEMENVGQALRGNPQLIRSGSPSVFLSRYQSQIMLPLLADDVVLGTINFAREADASYTQDDMRIAYMLALQLSSAIRNTRNFESLIQTRDELRIYADELEARNQELDAYGHTIAHDLKSPLSNIVIVSEFLAYQHHEHLPPESLERLKSITRSGNQMAKMIDQLLWLAKLRNAEEGITRVEINPVVESAVSRFTYALDAQAIQLDIADSLPNAMGHSQWLEEVFANLVSNAIKYMGPDNLNPQIKIRGTAQEAMVRYEVEDTGIGIKPADQAHLFQMFTQVHEIEAGGLGLGLSIVHRIINKLGGKLGVESTPGQGSTFWFTVPLAL